MRTPQEEMKVWRARVAELLEKEARCPGCIKLRNFAAVARFTSPAVEETDGPLNITTVCEAHQRIRHRMVFPPKPLRMY